ncbi:LutC/YkgG family protein [Dinghuibacter silviterrae]|uniref:L-lactate dehydrogenase complex protein LldG n=1 Tax=Dinghuibacter silviterrae TaxID=1539049 RepID=A0A4R8DPZ9_9BACT|nr:lactate utilization protein [Dinghuibacter silviterrae]TDW99484.1 L-lactate dehydrogenase complex protein LldG [Dinghuibacter silviterrae]
MKVSSAKENILKRIRQALSNPVPVPFPNSEGTASVYQPTPEELEVKFAEEFSALQGKFLYCAGREELLEGLRSLIQVRGWKETKVVCKEEGLRDLVSPLRLVYTDSVQEAAAGITGCEYLVARTGSILMSSAQSSGRTTSVYVPVHLCIAYVDQLVYDIKEGIQRIKEKYPDRLPSLITLASGPSRTADIEKTLVVGIHGPKEVFVFLVER